MDIRAPIRGRPLAVFRCGRRRRRTYRKRPDVRARGARVEAAQKARDLARGLRTRDVTVGRNSITIHQPFLRAGTVPKRQHYGVFK